YGNPARERGYICSCGEKMEIKNDKFLCKCGQGYNIVNNKISKKI
ncbi:MAG: dTDP-D-Fucp3N acetylase, partial [candidate division WS6 bacterium GW2011_GWE1_34_7]